jgi:hypothetical protein
VKELIASMVRDPSPIFSALERKMKVLADHARFEEAAEVRQRGALLERTLGRRARIQAMLAARDIVVRHGERALLIRNAQLAAALDLDGDIALTIERLRRVAVAGPVGCYQTAEQLTEARVLSGWIERHADELELLAIEGPWALPVGARPEPRFVAREPSGRRDRDEAL